MNNKLMCRYRLNEAVGTATCYDDGPAGQHNGTYSESPILGELALVKADSVAGSVNFNSAGYVALGTRTDLAALTTWSLEAWVRPTSTPGGSGIICSEYSGGIPTVFFELGCGADGAGSDSKFMVGFYNGSWAVVRDSITPTVGSIYHVVGTYDGTNLRLYRNGSLVAGPTAAGISLPTSVGVFYLGRRHDATATYRFPGEIGDIAIYNGVLTDHEVNDNYYYGSGQVLAPSSTVAAGSWTASGAATLQGAISESWPSDSEYIMSSIDPATPDVVEIALAAPANDPLTNVGHIIRYRYQKVTPYGVQDSGGYQINLTVRLMQGSTEIASWSHTNIGAVTTAAQLLSAAQADSITDYSNLRLKFEAVKV